MKPTKKAFIWGAVTMYAAPKIIRGVWKLAKKHAPNNPLVKAIDAGISKLEDACKEEVVEIADDLDFYANEMASK